MHQRTAIVTAMLFEGGLAMVALILAAAFSWWLDLPWGKQLIPIDENLPAAIARGVAATVPMLVGFFLLLRLRTHSLLKLRRQMMAILRMVLGSASMVELLIVACLAGIGEELLFRGVLQPVIAHWTNPAVGLIVASVLFGMAHSLTWLYLLLASLIGVYLGWLTNAYGDIVAAMVAHGLYDFVALWWLLKRRPARREATRGYSRTAWPRQR